VKIPSEANDRRRLVRDTYVPAMDLRPLIDGEFVDTGGGRSLAIVDPTLGTTLVEMPLGGRGEADAALSAARHAFDSGPWPQMAPVERAERLERLSALIENRLEELALLEAADVGKPVAGVRSWDIPNAAEVYRFYAQLARDRKPTRLGKASGFAITDEPSPVGVCVAIVPWNFPFPNISWKVAPALAAGCTVVVKPAERAPLSAQLLAQLVVECDFPPGVFNIVMGIGEEVGAALVTDRRTDKVTFTGSAETGREIARLSATHLPRLTLELGGKNPNVVMADADLDAALPGTVDAFFAVAGQNCCAGSRTLVEAAIFEEFTERLVELAAARVLGDPLDDATEQGPQIDAEHLRRIESYVEAALEGGARRVTKREEFERGFFFSPTILTDLDPGAPIAREEVFGPVGCLLPFADKEEAIAMANDTEFGLSASLWTSETDFAERFAQAARVGTCWINSFGLFETVAPWGGTKGSGFGRELGSRGLEPFLNPKTVYRPE